MGRRSGCIQIDVAEYIGEISDEDLLDEISDRKLIVGSEHEALPLDLVQEAHLELLRGRPLRFRRGWMLAAPSSVSRDHSEVDLPASRAAVLGEVGSDGLGWGHTAPIAFSAAFVRSTIRSRSAVRSSW